MDKKVIYGATSTLIVMLAVIALVVVNLIIGQFGIKSDMTADRKFSISKETKQIINDLNEDFTIYALFPTGSENDDGYRRIMEIIDQYAVNSSRIDVAYKDITLYPAFIYECTGENIDISPGSVIVKGNGSYKIITPFDMVTQQINMALMAYENATLEIEPKITNSIESLLQNRIFNIYGITGHGEPELDENFISYLGFKSYNYQPLNLFESNIPNDCDALIITTPARDYSPDERDKLTNYLGNEGNALVIAGGDAPFDSYANFNSVINAYGVSIEYMRILEGNTSSMYSGEPSKILPGKAADHEITQSINDKKINILTSLPQNIKILDEKKASLTIEKLLETSPRSFGKKGSASVNKEEGDENGPFIVAAAVTDLFWVSDIGYMTRLVVCSSSALLNKDDNDIVYNGNFEFIVSSLDWVTSRGDTSTYIEPKDLTGTLTMTLTGAQQRNIKVVTIGVIPGIILLAGFVVWIRRKNR